MNKLINALTQYPKLSTTLAAMLLGGIAVFGFAPFSYTFNTFASLYGLCLLWLHAPSRKRAAWIGFMYGLTLFLGGAHWVYVAMHDTGGMPPLLAGLCTLVLAAVLALFPMLAGALQHQPKLHKAMRALVLIPIAWSATELLRGTVFTGLPWLSMGMGQHFLQALAPLVGATGISLLLMLLAGVAASFSLPMRRAKIRSFAALNIIFMVAISSSLSLKAQWVKPEGAPLTISVIQGNIHQTVKWDPEIAGETLQLYETLTRQSKGQLVIWPETALPMFQHQVPSDYLYRLYKIARIRKGDILYGTPILDPDGRYYNALVSTGSSPTQQYRKQHLVPFGEYNPAKPLFGWFFAHFNVPMADFSKGENNKPLAIAGQKIAASICYEDIFGGEIARTTHDATLMVNISNDGWFGDSVAPDQHLQMNQMRARENQRFMVRATNTGISAIIDPRGNIVSSMPTEQAGVLEGKIQGFTGITPYARWGDTIVYAMMLALALAGIATHLWARWTRKPDTPTQEELTLQQALEDEEKLYR